MDLLMMMNYCSSLLLLFSTTSSITVVAVVVVVDASHPPFLLLLDLFRPLFLLHTKKKKQIHILETCTVKRSSLVTSHTRKFVHFVYFVYYFLLL